jgi:hypothetical protein
MSCIIISLIRFWSKPTLQYTDPRPLHQTSNSEYAQTTQDKIDYHVYPSGTHIIKAFSANDFVFYNKNGHVLKKKGDSSLHLATSVQITWHIQKNRQNGQKIKLSADTKNPAICPVRGALQMVESLTSCTTGQHAGHLIQNQESPIAIHHRQQDCYTPLQSSSKESTTIYFSWWPQEIALGRMANLRLVDKRGNLSSWSYKY